MTQNLGIYAPQADISSLVNDLARSENSRSRRVYDSPTRQDNKNRKNTLRGRSVNHMSTTLMHAPLTAEDRCDRCGAQAYVRVTLDGGAILLFCGHHFKEHEDRLRAVAINVHDETSSLANA